MGVADEDQGQWTGTRQHPRSAVRSRHSLEPPREMQWHHKDAASGDPGTGNHQALGNAGIKRYFRVREPRPRGGGGSARSLCTRRRPPQEHASPCRVPGSSSDAASETPRPPAARRRSGPPFLLGRLVLTLVSPLSAGGCRQDQREQTGFRRSLHCCHLRARRVATWWKLSR